MKNGGTLIRRGGLCGCAAAMLLLLGCAEQADNDTLVVTEGSNDTISYQFVTAEIGDVALTQKVRCTYRQQNEQEVSFSLTGRVVDKVYVEEGDMVKKGDLLAELSAGNLKREIEDLEYRIARNELLLEYADANENLDISQAWVNHIYNHMLDDEGIEDYVASIQKNYRYQREDCEDALELDRQELTAMRQELKDCSVYAGMDGMIYDMEEELVGSTSKAEEVVMHVVDNSQCLFETEAPEYAPYFKEGEKVSMVINVGDSAGEYELLPYHISEWGESQQFSVVSGPMTSGIEVGTGGTIQFALDSRTQVLCLPKTVVYSADDKYYVYVQGEGDIREIRWVEIGLIGDDKIEIRSGLEEGERVIRG